MAVLVAVAVGTTSAVAPLTQFEVAPLRAKPFSVPVLAPLVRSLSVVRPVFVPLATPWLNG